jgi:hypothetical protein
MDPNAALNAILRGHMPHEHIEALRSWLAGGGFAPSVELPADRYEYLACMFVEFAEVLSANSAGLVYFARNTHGKLVQNATVTWYVLMKEIDEEQRIGDRLDKRDVDAENEARFMAGLETDDY